MYEIVSKQNGWISLLVENTWKVQAQVFSIPSKYGIGARDIDGNWLCDPDNLPQSARISRLTIRQRLETYNYDRGSDFDFTPPGLLDRVIGYVLDAMKG
jgi:hypothetical protein